MPEDKPTSPPSYFDVSYGIASASMTVGNNSIATTGGYYHGLSVRASAADCTIIVYDHGSSATGSVIDVVFVDFSVNNATKSILYYPVMAKKGIQVNVSETGAIGTVFYNPKG